MQLPNTVHWIKTLENTFSQPLVVMSFDTLSLVCWHPNGVGIAAHVLNNLDWKYLNIRTYNYFVRSFIFCLTCCKYVAGNCSANGQLPLRFLSSNVYHGCTHFRENEDFFQWEARTGEIKKKGSFFRHESAKFWKKGEKFYVFISIWVFI